MSKRQDAIIFDGDDTLWQNQIFYEQAKEQFYKLMENQGFDRKAVTSKLSEIDVSNVQRFGFSRRRFPESLKETYEYFCRNQGRPVDPAILKQVYRIGNSVFHRKPVLMDGAQQVLEQLSKEYRLYLYTSGDPYIQRRKLKYLKLAKYFEAIYIRERKNEAELQDILHEQNLDPKKTWMIGNSLRSDINPALKLGLKCIWVRSSCWEYDTELPITSDILQVNSLQELPKIIKGIQS